MHALVGVTLPSYDEKTDAVLLYSETNVTVLSADKIRTHVREAYKILRPEGRERGTVDVYFNPRPENHKSAWLVHPGARQRLRGEGEGRDRCCCAGRGWRICSTDTKYRVLRIPAPDVGNIVGYEYEVEEQPFWLQDIWDFQETDPVRESHYSLQLPPGLGFTRPHGFRIRR